MAKILEVGCGRTPLAGREGSYIVSPDDEYTGLDLFKGLSRGKIREIQLQTKLKSGLGKVSIMRGDARNLPFPDRYFDQVIFTNVFGRFDNLADAPQMAREAARVIAEPLGQVIVAESYSPQYMPIDLLDGIMGDAGLMQWGGPRRDPAIVAQFVEPTDPRNLSGQPLAWRDYVAIFFRPPQGIGQS